MLSILAFFAGIYVLGVAVIVHAEALTCLMGRRRATILMAAIVIVSTALAALACGG